MMERAAVEAEPERARKTVPLQLVVVAVTVGQAVAWAGIGSDRAATPVRT
jgi:hypothetical protein